MFEIFRHYYNKNQNLFVIVIFKTKDGYIANIFLNRKVINEFRVTLTEEEFQNMKLFSSTNPFSEIINLSSDWIKNNTN